MTAIEALRAKAREHDDEPEYHMSDTEIYEAIWKDVERQARAHLSEATDAVSAQQTIFGEHIAWSNRIFARTDSLSPVHRVGARKDGDPYTTCGEPIPHPLNWLALSPRLIAAMEPCRFCEAEYARLTNERAA